MNYRVYLFVVMLICAVRNAAGTSLMPEPVVDPREYASHSGEWKLWVNPSHRHARGEGSYRFSRNGKVLWEAKLPYTLYDARVINDGMITGYAYTQGYYGFSGERGNDSFGDLVLVILNPRGETILEERIPRKWGHGYGSPTCSGVMVDASTRVVFFRGIRPDDQKGDIWRRYELDSGKRLEDFNPAARLQPDDTSAWSSVTAADFVPGTRFLLLQWREYTYKPGDKVGQTSSRFMLLNEDGGVAWQELLSGDLTYKDEQDNNRRMARYRNYWAGGILSFPAERQFEILHNEAAKAVTYEISGGDVREISRKAFEYSPPATQPAAVELKKIGELNLAGSTAEPVIRKTYGRFDLDDQGRIGAIRTDPTWPTFLLCDSTGKLFRESALRELGKSGRNHLLWLNGDRWLVTAYDAAVPESRSKGWWLDANTGALTPIETFDAPSIDKISRADDGFAVYGKMHYRNTICDELIMYDRDGKVLWKIDENLPDRGRLGFARSATALSDGRVAVLQSGAVEILTEQQPEKNFDLGKMFGAKPQYPATISADRDGGFIVEDFPAEKSIWRISADGKVLANFACRYPDGTKFRPYFGLRIDRNNRLWASDGDAIVRLDDNGVVDLTLGASPSDGNLQQISSVAVSNDGVIAVASARGGVMKLLDRDGHSLKSINFKNVKVESFDGAKVTNGADGSFYLRLPSQPPKQFSKDGESIEPTQFDPKSLDRFVSVQQVCPSRDGTLWLSEYQSGYLIGKNGKVIKKLQRRADGGWLHYPEELAVAPDGSCALYDRGGERPRGDVAPAAITIFSPEGTPHRTITLPFGGFHKLDYDGQTLVCAAGTKFLIYPADGQSMTFEIKARDGQSGSWIYPHLVNGNELWLVWLDGTIEKYSLPAG